MRIPVYLEVAQWALLFGLGSLVVVLYRQLGRLLSHDPGPANPGPAVGTRAAPIRYARLPDGAAGQLAPGDGQPALIAFVDPTCPACEQLVGNLGALAATGELDGYHLLHAARADMLRRIGANAEAARSYERALSLATNLSERRFLSRRLHDLQTDQT